MDKVIYEGYRGDEVTESMLQEASQLFSHHYGIWDENAAKMVGEFAKAGKLTIDGLVCLLKASRWSSTA